MANVFPASQAIVLGGGLAGVSAANTVLECGGKVAGLKDERIAERPNHSNLCTSEIAQNSVRIQEVLLEFIRNSEISGVFNIRFF